MSNMCAKCGDPISNEYQTEAYWEAGPNGEPICATCGDAVIDEAFGVMRAEIEWGRHYQKLVADCADLRAALDNARAALETDSELLQSGRESDRLLAISHMEDAARAARNVLESATQQQPAEGEEQRNDN